MKAKQLLSVFPPGLERYGFQNRQVHALSCIMGDRGKIVKKQSGKEYVFLHISVLS